MLPLFRHVRVRSWEFINVFKWELRVFCMKALSLKQPFAELILQGKKVIELRKWNTRFRGEFLIHASKVSDVDAMKRFGFVLSDVARVEEISCKGKLNFWDFDGEVKLKR